MVSKSDVAQTKTLRQLQGFVGVGLGGLTHIILKSCPYSMLMLYKVGTATAGSKRIGFQL